MEKHNQKEAWLDKTVFKILSIEAKEKYPLETGGILMGYFGEPGKVPVIEYASGPGPNAIHLKDGYIPDQEYDESIIATIYTKSDRQITYLGDWHTHPAPIDKLSYKDKKTLKKITTYKSARVNMPLMLILSYHCQWRASVWQGKIIRKSCWRKRLVTNNLTVRYFK